MTNSSRESEGQEKKRGFAWVAESLDSLLMTFALALVFITFVMQTFVIPTGSMADTLLGAHFRLRCQQCGYRYNFGFVPERYGLPQNTIARGRVQPVATRCPSCGYFQAAGGAMPISGGNRILVMKCFYELFEPRRWDVSVFKNPIEPKINYIKRLVGLPGETLEIIDGDLYVDGKITRKPKKVQQELWMPVFDNNFQPARPRVGSFNGHAWKQPFRNADSSMWTVAADNPAQFQLDSHSAQINTLKYDTNLGNGFRTTYAYNDTRQYNFMPFCSDLKVSFQAKTSGQAETIGASLSKYENVYKGFVNSAGDLVISRVGDYGEEVLARKALGRQEAGVWEFEFSNVDHLLTVRLGDEELIHDLGTGPEDAGRRYSTVEPRVNIFGAGKLSLSSVRVFRDIHYTGNMRAYGSEMGTATQGNAIELGDDEFCMLGDNSPSSKDGRWWETEGIGNWGLRYKQGIVPREYMVGKAFVVIWAGGFRPFDRFPISIIPDFGQLRFINGG